MLVKVTLQFELGICPSMGVCRKEAAFNFISFYITTYKSIKIGSKFLGLNLSKITVRIMTHQVERNENKNQFIMAPVAPVISTQFFHLNHKTSHFKASQKFGRKIGFKSSPYPQFLTSTNREILEFFYIFLYFPNHFL